VDKRNLTINSYLQLIKLFLDDAITAKEFESQYSDKFLNEVVEIGGNEFKILDALFAAVDAYCEDESIRSEGDLDEKGLHDEAKNAYEILSKSA